MVEMHKGIQRYWQWRPSSDCVNANSGMCLHGQHMSLGNILCLIWVVYLIQIMHTRTCIPEQKCTDFHFFCPILDPSNIYNDVIIDSVLLNLSTRSNLKCTTAQNVYPMVERYSIFQISTNKPNDHKGPEYKLQVYYTKVKYGEGFTAATQHFPSALVKVNKFWM